jgi:CRP/FNR family transcriptional regulator
MNAIETYLQHYKMVCPAISQEELEYVASVLTVINLKPKDYFLEQGNTQKALGFVTSGLMKSFYLDDKGNEITCWFMSENEYATHFSGFIRQKPSKYFIQCIEPTEIVLLPYTEMQNGYQKYKNLERYGRIVTEEVLVMLENRVESFLFEKAEQRYLNFLKNSPDLFNRISLTDLASYLGIERQSLSRIRNAIRFK